MPQLYYQNLPDELQAEILACDIYNYPRRRVISILLEINRGTMYYLKGGNRRCFNRLRQLEGEILRYADTDTDRYIVKGEIK